MDDDRKFGAFLEGYRNEGALESSGGFSLSDQKAQERLRRFQLVEPKLYVLNLQAAAVSGGATWVDFYGDSDDLYFECDADLGEAEGLADLNSVALSDSALVPLRELALALNGSLALAPKRLAVHYWDGQSAMLIEWDSEQFSYTPGQGPPEARTPARQPSLTFHLKERPSRRTVAKFLSTLSGAVAADSEQEAVARYCNRSPCQLRYNGRDVVRPFDTRGTEKALLVTDQAIPQDHPLGALLALERRDSPGAFRGLVARGGARLPPWMTIVLNGVNFLLDEEALGGVRGFIYTEALRKDLSQSQLVQDERYTEMTSFLSNLL